MTFELWLQQANPGDKHVYYHGLSLTDSIISNQVREIVWKSACLGQVYLFQKKLGRDNYQFIAMKANSPPYKWLIPLSEAKPIIKHHYRRYTGRQPRIEHIEVSTHG